MTEEASPFISFLESSSLPEGTTTLPSLYTTRDELKAEAAL